MAPARHAGPLVPSAFATAGGAQAMLARYRPKLEGARRPLERLLTVAARLESVIWEQAGAGEIVEALLKHDARRQVFALEAALSMYSQKFGRSVRRQLEHVERLEHLLGEASMLRQVGALAEQGGVVAPVVAELRRERRAQHKQLTDFVERHWMPQAEHKDRIPVLHQLLECMADRDFGSYQDDRKFLLGCIAAHLKRIERTDFDMDDMAGGIHPFRRALRWTSLCVEAAGGLVQLSDAINPIAAFAPLLRDPVVRNIDMKLPDGSREAAPLSISRSLFAANTKYAIALGAVKDGGEPVEVIARAYRRCSPRLGRQASRRAARTWLGNARYGEANIHSAAGRIYRRIKSAGLLRALRREFERERC